VAGRAKPGQPKSAAKQTVGTRRGNGAGKGDGWGGPPKGEGTRYVKGEVQPLQGKGNTAEVVAKREARLARMEDVIFDLAENAQREETQLAAAIAFRNQILGLPIARSINANVDDPAKVVIVTGVRRAGDDDADG
jgi:hypothetical protein